MLFDDVGEFTGISFEVVEFCDLFPLIVLPGDCFPTAAAHCDGFGFSVTKNKDGFDLIPLAN